MADHFEQAKDEILKRTVGNGGPQALDILTALGALAEDTDETAIKLAAKVEVQHTESLAAIEANRQVLISHCAEANVRDERISVLEEWRHDQVKHCEDRVMKLIGDEHEGRHSAHMAAEHPVPRRSEDPEDADYSSDRRVWLMWSIGSRLTNILVAALTAATVLLVNWLATGRP